MLTSSDAVLRSQHILVAFQPAKCTQPPSPSLFLSSKLSRRSNFRALNQHKFHFPETPTGGHITGGAPSFSSQISHPCSKRFLARRCEQLQCVPKYMGSITQSPDRVAQVISSDGVQLADGFQAVDQAFPGNPVAEMVYESRQQHHPSISDEGVASAGHPPQPNIDRMDENPYVAGSGGFEPPLSAAAACEGETSGGDHADHAAGGSNGYGELAETGGDDDDHQHHPSSPLYIPPPASPMDFQTNASALAAPSPGGKRKSSCEVSDFLDAKRSEGGAGLNSGAGLNRVPSDLAMVMGLSDGEAGGEPEEARHRLLPMDATDSNIAGILAGVGGAPTVNEGDTAAFAQQGLFMLPPLLNATGTTTTAATIDAGGAGAAAGRPSDADIIAWENQIKEEEVRNIPLVGEMEDIGSLEDEYKRGSSIFLAKIAALRRGYSAIRRTRGDGNCFFRSFVFAYLENILLTGDLVERDRAMGRINVLRQGLLDAGYEELVLESPLELLLGMLRSIGSPTDPLTVAALESNMQSEDISNYIVFLLRMATSAEVKRRADFFAPFVMGLSDMDVDTFCRTCIDPMGEESDHVEMVALTDALQVPVRVVYLDRSLTPGGGGGGGSSSGGGGGGADGGGGVTSGDDHHLLKEGGATGPGASFASVAHGGGGGATSTAGTVISVAAGATTRGGGGGGGGGTSLLSSVKVDIHDFVPEEGAVGSREPRVHLLYRPGHYDVLYPSQ